MGQRHCYQLKVVSTWILYFMIESIILNFILLVAETNNLFGIDSAKSLHILKILNSIAYEKNVNSNNTRETNFVSDILNKYESIFHGINKMKEVNWVKLATDKSVTPVAQKHQNVPFHLCLTVLITLVLLMWKKIIF